MNTPRDHRLPGTALPLTRAELLALDPATLAEPLPWTALLSPNLTYHASTWEYLQQRRRLGISDHGILDDPGERSRAWATCCCISVVAGDMAGERFRLIAVQVALRDGCCAWHAASVAAGDVSRCPCRACVEAREAA